MFGNHIKKKIETVMYGGSQSRIFSFASFLYIISLAYGGLQNIKATFYRQNILRSRHLPCKVISIGNITVGGTGKTPMTMYVAKRVKGLGYNVAVVSRGYKGSAEKTGGVVSDGKEIFLGPEKAGDEPYMIACNLRNIPVIIGKDRFVASMRAIKEFQSDVIVLDDGFQHMKLARDIDLVLMDFRQPFGNYYLLPRGTLREPILSLCRSDACILTRTRSDLASVNESSVNRLRSIVPESPLFSSFHIPYYYKIPAKSKVSFDRLSNPSCADNFSILAGRRVTAFSGIARSDEFEKTVENLKCEATAFFKFPDHHRYSEKDFFLIQQAAKQTTAEYIITTEKDYARIAHRMVWPLELIVLGVKISFRDDEKRFDDFITQRLAS